VGTIDAYLFGLEVYAAPIDTCGLGQQIDVLGLVTGVLDALNCPVASGASVKIGFEMAIPDEAQGLGALQIFVNGTDQNKVTAVCLNLTVNL
jgi:hydrogenase maturation factor HypE